MSDHILLLSTYSVLIKYFALTALFNYFYKNYNGKSTKSSKSKFYNATSIKDLNWIVGRNSDKDFWLTRCNLVSLYPSYRDSRLATLHPSSFYGGSTMRSETGASSKIDLAAAKSSIFRVAVADKSER